MQIGILFEGDKDERPLKVLIRRILNHIYPDSIVEVVPFGADGSIEPKMATAITEFFFNRACGLAVFVADSDGDKSKRGKLTTKAKKLNISQHPIVIACPDPELEQWFFDEEAAIKKTFNLSGAGTIPHNNLKPKERLNKLYREALESDVVDITETINDIYERLAELVDLITLNDKHRSSSYQKFYTDLEFTLRNIS